MNCPASRKRCCNTIRCPTSPARTRSPVPWRQTFQRINDFRFGRNHLMTNNLNYWTVNNLLDAGTKLGIPNFTGDTTFHNPGIPDITVSGFIGLGNAGSNWYQDDTTWHGYDQLSYRHGSHNIMAGVEIRKLITARAAANSPRGLFNFTCSRSGNAAA